MLFQMLPSNVDSQYDNEYDDDWWTYFGKGEIFWNDQKNICRIIKICGNDT